MKASRQKKITSPKYYCLALCVYHSTSGAGTESVELFTEDQAFSPSYYLALPPPLYRQQAFSLSQFSCVSPVELTQDRGGEGEGKKSQIIRRRENLVLYESFNTLWTGGGGGGAENGPKKQTGGHQ